MDKQYEISIDKSSSVPIYQQIEEGLTSLIGRGIWSEGEKIPSEDELSIHLKVSRMTVRQALAQIETKGLLQKIQGKGTFIKSFTPEAEKNTGPGSNLGLYIAPQASRHHPLYLELVESIERQADVMDSTISIYTDTSRLENANGLWGVVLISRVPHDTLKILKNRNIPFVLAYEHRDTYGEEFPCVLFDSVEATFKSAEHFLAAGHRRIALFTGILNGRLKGEGSRSRLRGYKEALEKYGVSFDGSLIKECDYDNELTRRMTEELFSGENPPDAVIACDDMGAGVIINQLLEMNLKVPEDVSVMGVGDYMLNSICRVPLTTYTFPAAEIGAKAAFVLHCIANNLPFSKVTWIKGELVVRKSCGVKTS